MYICNLKLDIKKTLIIVAIIAISIALIVEVSSRLNITKKGNFDYVLDENNFTDILKSVHDNIEDNVGKTIKLSGFVFRLPDFEDGYFVCGRNMLLDNDEKVVGFLCKYEGKFNFKDSEWIEITGTFEKGYYMTDMPVIHIESINKITAPANTYVKTPNYL